MISVKGLSAKVGTFSLHDINFNIEKKECLTIIGPNGCGKTTLIECIAGLHNSKGNILIDNVDVTSLPPEKRKVGYVPQDFVLFPNMTTDQNIGFGIIDEKENRIEKIGQVMHLLEIENLKGRNVKTLSGGEKQKVALARALAINPKVLLLDEPFSLLDPLAKEKLRKDLKRIIEKILTSLEVPVIYVSHDLSDAMASDKIAVMNNGKMEQVGLRSEVLDNPKSVFVAEYFGFNVLDGVVSSANGDSINIQIEDKIIQACKMQLAEGEKVTVVLKPQDIIVSIDKEIPLLKWRKCQCNTLQGYVTEINNTGPMARLIIDVGFPLKMDKSIHVLDDLELNVGREVFVHFTSHTTKVIPN